MVKKMIISALLLALFAILGTGLVAYTEQSTADRIAANQRQALLESLQVLIPKTSYDNNLYRDHIRVIDLQQLGTKAPVDVYRARKAGKPVALVMTPVAPDGYGGDIRLLVAINYDGTLAGVRVVEEHETPGLGDNIEADRSPWIFGFKGRSLKNPTPAKWKVKKDGGVFDQFTGATITPRAVVKAVYHSLLYYKAHRDMLFAPLDKPAPKEAHHE